MSKRPEGVAPEYQGRRFKVVHCEGALESYREALSHVEVRKRGSMTRGMMLQIQRLADGHRMSAENFPKEGELPTLPGQGKAKHFHALKRIPIRGYCWLSPTKPNTYFISHYIYKDQRRLAGRDTQRVGRNWRRIEEDGYER